jgi:predicted DNA-binding transcriptional regulator AlpA
MSINTLNVDVQNTLLLKNDRLLRDAEVQKLTGVRKTRRCDLMRDGKFPLPIKICGGRTNYWLASEIEKFIADQVTQHRAEQAEKLVQLASDPFNALMSAFVGKPSQNSQGACNA